MHGGVSCSYAGKEVTRRVILNWVARLHRLNKSVIRLVGRAGRDIRKAIMATIGSRMMMNVLRCELFNRMQFSLNHRFLELVNHGLYGYKPLNHLT